MGRPVGSKNKPKEEVKEEVKFQTSPPVVIPSIHYDLIMGVRVLRNGPFKGLWELVQLDNKMGRKFVLTDANSRGQVITMMNREVMRIVVQMNAPV